jgi:hypothetical protein
MAVIWNELINSFVRHCVPRVFQCNVHFVAAWVNLGWLLVMPSAVVSVYIRMHTYYSWDKYDVLWPHLTEVTFRQSLLLSNCMNCQDSTETAAFILLIYSAELNVQNFRSIESLKLAAYNVLVRALCHCCYIKWTYLYSTALEEVMIFCNLGYDG